MNQIDIISVGADPELFLKTYRGQPRSAEGLIGGTKQNPKPMEGLSEGFCIQEDNVAAEFNIPASLTPAEFAENIIKAVEYVRSVAKQHKLKPYIVPDADFPLAQVMTPHALELGCDPDYNAWTMEKNPRPRPPRMMRTAAGHIHVGWYSPDDEQRWAFVRAMDVVLGLPSILVTKPNRRRELYGRAGACRLKPYGIEYRTPDNFYLESYEMAKKVAYTAWIAAKRLNESQLFLEEINRLGTEIQRAINLHDQALANELMEYFRVGAL